MCIFWSKPLVLAFRLSQSRPHPLTLTTGLTGDRDGAVSVPDDDVVRLDEFLELVATSIHFQQHAVRVREPAGQVVHLGLDVRRCADQ